MNKQNKSRLQQLELEAFRIKHPIVPEHAIPRTVWSDSSTNALTKCVISFIVLSGYQAERINTVGGIIDNTKIVTDVIGRTRRIGSVTRIPTTSTKGSADISATIHGRSVKVEIKFGKDRQSDAQKKYQKDIESAGGIYIIVRTFDGFIEWYDEWLNKIKLK
jgi:hypothetical protein